MTSETNTDRKENEASLLHEIADRVRYIHRKVNEIGAQVEDNYSVLRQVLDATTGENGHSWIDLYEEDADL